MKIYVLACLGCLLSAAAASQSCITVNTECDGSYNYCGPYELSRGIYRIPFADGTDVTVTNDHLNHCPRGRIDMLGDDGDDIAAAADGWVRWIEDDNSTQCDCSQNFCLNNYIWIEHPNGEWTKYTHMQYHSVPASVDVGDWVTAGTLLGTEGEVGCASGVHLHFEVAQPVDTNTLVFDPDGGYIDGDWAKNMIPVFCDITNNIFSDGATYTAGDCSLVSCPISINNGLTILGTGDIDVDFSTTTITHSTVYEVGAYGAAEWQATTSITLIPGFVAEASSTFLARIGLCNVTPERLEAETENSENAGGSMVVFPNPSPDGVFNLLMPEEASGARLIIHDVTGKIIFSADDVSGKYSLNLTDRACGVYFMTAELNGNRFTAKLIR